MSTGRFSGNSGKQRTEFLPINREDMEKRGWEVCDFIIVSGDAYVDHPSFAAAILGRMLEAEGFRAGIIAQPRWQGAEGTQDFLAMGEPRLAWLVSAGAMDSMVAHYTANNKPRSEDSYSPGGKPGFRPDRALLAYTACIKSLSQNKPVIIGGIEASLRRFAHYDYWSNTVKHSILLDTKADLLVYGMGEYPLREIARRLESLHGESYTPEALRGIRGTVWRTGKKDDLPVNAIHLPSFQEIKSSPEAYCTHYRLQEEHTDPFQARIVIEQSEERFVVQELPSLPLETADFDRVMELPYTRSWHPVYNESGGIPALSEVLFSLTSCRGCFGTCSFCAITFHQGRLIQTRSHESLEREARLLTAHADFKGYIHDVGGPSANFRIPACDKQSKSGACPDRQCLGVNPCPALKADHSDYRSLLAKIRAIPGIKKVFIRSGIRYDYLMLDPDKRFFRDLCEWHISGQLKVAPEHTNDTVLGYMRKSTHGMYKLFSHTFTKMNEQLGKKQYLVPYYIASHPGAGLNEAIDTAVELKKTGFFPDQVQDFYPTPGTLATCMYYTAQDPFTGKPLYVAKGARERAMQRALLQCNKKENHPLAREALRMAQREELIPFLLGKDSR